jgi:hypothetical protein
LLSPVSEVRVTLRDEGSSDRHPTLRSSLTFAPPRFVRGIQQVACGAMRNQPGEEPRPGKVDRCKPIGSIPASDRGRNPPQVVDAVERLEWCPQFQRVGTSWRTGCGRSTGSDAPREPGRRSTQRVPARLHVPTVERCAGWSAAASSELPRIRLATTLTRYTCTVYREHRDSVLRGRDSARPVWRRQ